MNKTTIGSLSVLLTLIATPIYADVQQTDPVADDAPMSVTMVFKLRHKDELARYIRQTTEPGPHYHQFLTPETFQARFGPDPARIAKAVAYARNRGLEVDHRYANGMAIRFTAPADRVERAFGIQLANYTQSGDERMRKHFYRPTTDVALPAVLAENDVLTLVGLSNQYRSKSHLERLPQAKNMKNLTLNGRQPAAIGEPDNPLGQLSAQDVAKLYNVGPLYERGLRGQGMTLGIATYAKFLPSDAETYWNSIGLDTKPDRITQVSVGAGGEYGAVAGTGETSLDVEQAGGLAPYADIVVYDAPNTTQGTLDLFSRIVSDNQVDTLSYSWGLPEIFYDPGLNGGVDFRSILAAQNQLFMEAAAQGISIFVAAGDAGAYDTNRSNPFPDVSKTLTVDNPAGSPYVTAAGGTTLPFGGTYTCDPDDPNSETAIVDVTAERAWGLDYLAQAGQICAGASPSEFGLFASGGGGGVSVEYGVPYYQRGLDGIETSAPSQAFIEYGASPFVYDVLPSGFAGRNVPDISLNADGQTGYFLYTTLEGVQSYYGGTSFVAPQLNGMAALFAQDNGGRLGLLNPALYRLFKAKGYGPDSPFNDITSGSNWFWQSRPGYDPATGIGTINAAKLSAALAAP